MTRLKSIRRFASSAPQTAPTLGILPAPFKGKGWGRGLPPGALRRKSTDALELLLAGGE